MKTWGSPFASLFTNIPHTHSVYTRRDYSSSQLCICIHNKHKAAHYIYIYRLIFSAIFPRNGRAIEKFADQNFQIFVFLFGFFMFHGRKSWCVYTKTAGENFERDKNLVAAFAESSKCFVLWESYNISSLRFPVSVFFLSFLLVSGAGIKFNMWNEIKMRGMVLQYEGEGGRRDLMCVCIRWHSISWVYFQICFEAKKWLLNSFF